MAELSSPARVSDLEFGRAMAALSPLTPIAIAVSGGADSMALLHLSRQWIEAKEGRQSLCVLTVDHGLRDGAQAEARQVAAWCQSLGVKHQILSWRGDKPHSDIQAAARRARYSLMRGYCMEQGIRSLLLGHQFEDQAETFLMRLGRGSGVNGLAAMAPSVIWDGVRLLRPLLSFSRARLQATLVALGQPWIEDPSNENPRFLRVRTRSLLPELQNAGISADRIVATAQRMRRVRTALEQITNQVVHDAVQLDPAGFAVLRLEALFTAPEEIGLRVLARILMVVGGQEYTPRLVRLERLYGWLRTGPVTGGRTLAGCRIIPRKGQILLLREPAALGPEISLSPGETRCWDNRFQVRLRNDVTVQNEAVFTVRAIGKAGLFQIADGNPMPRIACYVVPGLWLGERLLAAPHMGFVDPDYGVAAGFEAIFSSEHRLLPEYSFEKEKM